ncbi:MAG: DapH/DapD/GlmU-related protein, partial [Acidimicrobiia bacterium]|nr:DapH/DapD/GlmU-related protein [Acidimicrobiia bacterium]
AVLHETVDIGPWATVGHAGIVHNCVVGERALVGMNAVVLDGATVGERAIVAAGSVVTEGTEVPPRSLVAGAPAEVRRKDLDETPWAATADLYAERARRYRDHVEVVEE